MKLKANILDEISIKRTLIRISHEILEKNKGSEDLILMGIKNKGVYIANRISDNIFKFEGEKIPVENIDISKFRDDLKDRNNYNIPLPNIEVENKTIILVDDVLFTGRTVRAAIDIIMRIGRPKSIQLAVLIDRGHRELPIRADYVGKNMPTSKEEEVILELIEYGSEDSVKLYSLN